MSDTLDALRLALSRRYIIDRELGRGGMATVYVALDKRHDRQVAIKVFPPVLAAAIGPERFKREIAITARLNHPHILPLYDSGQAAGALYYAMPLIKGESLRSLLDRNPEGLELTQIVRLAEQIAGALDYAYGLGVVHRDVTPDNILLSGNNAILADFGIARLIDAETLTESGLPIGTAMYRSPEQAAGQSKVDTASDIYSLGCLLYECLGGKQSRPYLANRFAVPAPGLKHLRSDIPKSIEVAVGRAMRIDPAERFESAGALARALTQRVPFKPPWRLARLAAAVIVLIAAVPSGFSLLRNHPDDLVTRRVMVGTFANRTGDRSFDVLGEMAGDYVARGLAETNLLEVIDSRSEAAPGLLRPPRDQSLIRRLASSAGAGTTIQGSYYRVGGNLHFETQVLDTRSGKLVASPAPVEGSVGDRVLLIEKLRQHVMGSLAAVLGSGFEAWQGASVPPSYEAYQEILAGQAAVWKLDYGSALVHYRNASRMDSTYVGAKAMMALAAALSTECSLVDSIAKVLRAPNVKLEPVDRGNLDWGEAQCRGDWGASLDAGRRVMSAAPRSISFSALLAVSALELFRPREAIDVLGRLSPQNMQFTAAQRTIRTGFLALAWHQRGDHQTELKVVRDGLRSLPDNSDLHADELVALAALGKLQELRNLRDAWQNNHPTDAWLWTPSQVNLCLGTELMAHGRVEDGHQLVSEAADWFRAHYNARQPLPQPVLCNFRLFIPAYYAGRFDEARTFYGRMLERDSLDVEAHEALGALAARRHDQPEVDRMEAWLWAHSSAGDRATITYSRARIAALSGNTDRAMSLLGEAMRAGLGFRMSIHADPDLESLRQLPAYHAMFALRG